jgi:hypothetical protein
MYLISREVYNAKPGSLVGIPTKTVVVIVQFSPLMPHAPARPPAY